MINSFHVKNFKSLKQVDVPMGRLNLFMGMNGMGKSSVIQSLLLLRQSFENQPVFFEQESNLSVLKINGELVRLGTASDILCQNADDDEISWKLMFTGNSAFQASYVADGLKETSPAIKGEYKRAASIVKEALFTDRFSYLSAEHIGPRQKYSFAEWDPAGMNWIGNNGQSAVPFLSVYGTKCEVPDIMRRQNARTKLLIDETSAWMQTVSPRIRMNAVQNVVDNDSQLLISFEGERMTTNNISPVNVGFGVPYALPLIVALLQSKPGDLILLENPESHLHPKGQAAAAELIARAAANGAQIVCETHSDHIINGIRVAMKHNILHAGDMVVTYFDQDNSLDTLVTTIDVDQSGNLSSYPPGLLDEWGDLMSELI